MAAKKQTTQKRTRAPSMSKLDRTIDKVDDKLVIYARRCKALKTILESYQQEIYRLQLELDRLHNSILDCLVRGKNKTIPRKLD